MTSELFINFKKREQNNYFFEAVRNNAPLTGKYFPARNICTKICTSLFV